MWSWEFPEVASLLVWSSAAGVGLLLANEQSVFLAAAAGLPALLLADGVARGWAVNSASTDTPRQNLSIC